MFVLSLSLYNTIEFNVPFFYAKSRTCSFIVCKLCLRPFYHSESGKIIMQVDEELKGQIHTEMMKAILKFEIRVK